MKTLTDYQKYNQLRDAMKCMVRAGHYPSPAFTDAWRQTEEIKNRHGGMPPMPDDEQASEMEACEMEACEMGNMEGRR